MSQAVATVALAGPVEAELTSTPTHRAFPTWTVALTTITTAQTPIPIPRAEVRTEVQTEVQVAATEMVGVLVVEEVR